jgi:hypothetical protein
MDAVVASALERVALIQTTLCPCSDYKSSHQSVSNTRIAMPIIPHHSLPCPWLAPTALLMSFAAGIGFAAMKHRQFSSPQAITQPAVSFLVRVVLVVLEDATPGLVNIHD